MFSSIEVQKYYKEYFPHEPPSDYDPTKPFTCINCGEFCKNHPFSQEVLIKRPRLFPSIWDLCLDNEKAVYSHKPICFKGEIVLP